MSRIKFTRTSLIALLSALALLCAAGLAALAQETIFPLNLPDGVMENTPEITIDYRTETLRGFDPGAAYAFDDGEPETVPGVSLEIPLDWMGKPLSIVKKGDGLATLDSEAQELPIPARPAAPEGVAGAPCRSIHNINGRITGVDPDMEYRPLTGAAWQGVKGHTITDLTPDYYLVRYKVNEDAPSFASAWVLAAVGEYDGEAEPSPELTMDYATETLNGFKPGAAYSFDGEAETVAGKTRAIEEEWMGNSLSIVKHGNGESTYDSKPLALEIPARPRAPEETAFVVNGCTNDKNDNGSLGPVDSGMEYRADGGKRWISGKDEMAKGLSPGSYLVRYKATPGAFASEALTLSVGAFSLPPGPTPSFAIDYINETLARPWSGEDYAINGEAVNIGKGDKPGIGIIPLTEGWYGATLSIVRLGDDKFSDSPQQVLRISARPPAPVGPMATGCSTLENNDGKITGLAMYMEYSANNGKTWTACPGYALTGLTPGEYLVRAKASNSLGQAASQSKTVTVEPSAILIENTPSIAVDYVKEELTGFDAGGVYEISAQGSEAETVSGAASYPIHGEWIKIESETSLSIIKKGDGVSSVDSGAQNLILPGRSLPPDGWFYDVRDCTTASNQNGIIYFSTKGSPALEYSADGGMSWISCEGNGVIEGLVPGVYLGRGKAVNDAGSSAFATDHTALTVRASLFSQEPQPEITIGYVEEMLLGFDPGGLYEISVGDKAAAVEGEEAHAIGEDWMGEILTITRKGNDFRSTDSEPVSLNIPSRVPAPADFLFEVGNCTAKSNDDGTILSNIFYYDGQEFSADGGVTWEDFEAFVPVTNLEPGIYLARGKASNDLEFGHFATDSLSLTVMAYDYGPADRPNVAIDYANELLTGFVGERYEIGAGGAKPVTVEGVSTWPIDDRWIATGQTLSIVQKSDGIYTSADSAPQNLAIPGRHPAPNAFDVTHCQSASNDSGAITSSVIDLLGMEYSTDGGLHWADCGVSVENLTPGLYLLREKGSNARGNERFTSKHAEVTIHAYTLVPEDTPGGVEINYQTEKLTGLEPRAAYECNFSGVTADEGGEIDLKPEWAGGILAIVKKGVPLVTYDSDAYRIAIPERPQAPSPEEITVVDCSYEDAGDGGIILYFPMEHSADGGITWYPASMRLTGLSQGSYLLRYPAVIGPGGSFASGAAAVAVGLAPKGPMPSASIDYVEEKLVGLASGMHSFSIAGAMSYGNVTDGTYPLSEQWMGNDLTIVKLTDSGIPESDAQALSIPSRLEAPPVTGHGHTLPDGSGGRITGLLPGLTELRHVDSGGGWMECAGNEATDLAQGRYEVRLKAGNGAPGRFSGKAATVTVDPFKPTRMEKPALTIDFVEERLTGFVPGGAYSINGWKIILGSDEMDIGIWWLGSELGISRQGDGIMTLDSERLFLHIMERLAAPDSPMGVDCTGDSAGDGKIIGVTAAMEYRKEPEVIWTSCGSSEITGLGEGTYEVRYQATEGAAFRSEGKTINIGVHYQREDTPAAYIDYNNETLVGFEAGGVYSFNGGEAEVVADVALAIAPEWFDTTVSIVKKSGSPAIMDSDPQVLSIPAKLPAPDLLTSDCTVIHNNDGRITGVDSTMEYRLEGAPGWTACPVGGTVLMNLVPGTYEVRVRARDTDFAGQTARAAIGGYSAPIEVPPEITIDYVNEMLTGFTAGAVYSINDSMAVIAMAETRSIRAEWFGTELTIIKKGDNATMVDSPAQILSIPARPTPPRISAVYATAPGTNDGKITGVSEAMEYGLDSSGIWEDCTTGVEIADLAPGNYAVRRKAVPGVSFASAQTSMRVGAGAAQIRSLSITAPDFDDVGLVYIRPEAKAIIIRNTGNIGAAITNVTVMPTTAFDLGGSGWNVPAATALSTWTIQPKAGLAPGTHTATIAVSYDDGAEATASVSITVTSAPRAPISDTLPGEGLVPEVSPGLAAGVVSGDERPDVYGKLDVVIDEAVVDHMVKLANVELSLSDRAYKGISATYENGARRTTELSVIITAGALARLKEADVQALFLRTMPFEFSFDPGAIASLLEQAGGTDILFTAKPAGGFGEEAMALIGGRPSFAIAIHPLDEWGEAFAEITDLGQGKATFGIHYARPRRETADRLKAIGIDGNGMPLVVENSVFEDDWLTWEDSQSAGVFGVGYIEQVE